MPQNLRKVKDWEIFQLLLVNVLGISWSALVPKPFWTAFPEPRESPQAELEIAGS